MDDFSVLLLNPTKDQLWARPSSAAQETQGPARRRSLGRWALMVKHHPNLGVGCESESLGEARLRILLVKRVCKSFGADLELGRQILRGHWRFPGTVLGPCC